MGCQRPQRRSRWRERGALFGAAALWAGRSIVATTSVATGTNRFGLDGGDLIGNAAYWECTPRDVVASQFLDDIVTVARAVVVGETGQSFGQNVVVVDVFQTRFPGDIEPQAMQQYHVLVLHGGRVRADAEGVNDAVGLNNLQYELPFGFRD